VNERKKREVQRARPENIGDNRAGEKRRGGKNQTISYGRKKGKEGGKVVLDAVGGGTPKKKGRREEEHPLLQVEI